MQFIDTATLSLANPGATKPVEIYVPLWFSNGTTTNAPTSTVDGGALIDGSAGLTSTGGTSFSVSNQLYTLSSKWLASAKFAFEACICNNTGVGNPTAYCRLYDITASTPVTASQVSMSGTSTNMTVLRSGQFTLTPGHVYAVTIWSSNASYAANISDASLIIFP